MFRVKNNFDTEIMKELFVPKISPYDLHNNKLFQRSRLTSVWHGTESVSYLGPKIWDLETNKIKNQMVVPWWMPKQNLQSISWASGAYIYVKNSFQWIKIKILPLLSCIYHILFRFLFFSLLIDYRILSFMRKLTLIVLIKTTVNASLFKKVFSINVGKFSTSRYQ